jgi:serine/threonine-protein kinase
VVALIVGLVLTNQSTPQATVPNVIGMTSDQAVEAIEGQNLVAQTGEPVVDCEQEEGQVESQEPAADEELDEGSTVTYRVCNGPEPVTIPERLVGLPEEVARAELEELELDVESVSEDSSEDPGTVLRVDPPEGTSVEVGSDVTLFVSAGNIVEVPNVVGETRAIAEDRLDQRGFDVNVETANAPPEDPDLVGTVQSQSPEAGSDEPGGSTVTIVVYPDGPDLEVSDPQVVDDQGTVSISWNNGIDGEVIITWGDGQSESGGAEDDATHQYELPPPGQTQSFTITITDADDENRSETREVTIEGPEGP